MVSLDFEQSIERPTAEQAETSDVNISDNYVALGVVRLFTEDGQTKIRGRSTVDEYPGLLIFLGLKRRWIKFDGISIGTRDGISYLRCYVLPEDVDRRSRGSLSDFHKVIRFLLDFVDCSPAIWNGDFTGVDQFSGYDPPFADCEESLFYIFNTLESPKPSISQCKDDYYSQSAMRDVLKNRIFGLHTSLYPYQRRSVAAMIQKESSPKQLRDPRKTEYTDMNGRPFYLDTHTGSLYKDITLYTEPQGGILAETMGYGKTLICLALILATRGHYSRIPQDRVDKVVVEPSSTTPTLLEMAARTLKHEGRPWKNVFAALTKSGEHYSQCIQELKRFERAYEDPTTRFETPMRRGKEEHSRLIHICSSTLLIVPNNLLSQWLAEIKRHLEPDALDILVIETKKDSLPQWTELIKYDLVVMTRACFEAEYIRDTHSGKPATPLLQVRWLRVICDEGHGFASSSTLTHAMALLDQLNIDRRWLVTGTPSSTLHGVEIGLSTTDVPASHRQETGTITRNQMLSTTLDKRKAPTLAKAETADLERLRLMVVNFLKLQPWANSRRTMDSASWKQYLAPIEKAGRRRTRPVLREVLQTLIVRHRIEHIDLDLTLPPLRNKTVYLSPAYHDKLTINLFTMILASNYVTSEREDQDYMFHPANRKRLEKLISNLRQATFHWVAISEEDVKNTLEIGNKYLDDKLDEISDADGALLTEAVLNAQRALGDESWLAFSNLHEMGVLIEDFSEDARKAWAFDGQDSNPTLMGTVQARDAQKLMRANIMKYGIEGMFDAFVGQGLKCMSQARDRAATEKSAVKSVKSTEHDTNGFVTRKSIEVGSKDEPKVRNTATQSMSPNKALIPRMRQRNGSLKQDRRPMIAAKMPRIAGFTSAKLTYLITSLLSLSADEKAIVFYSSASPNTAFWIAEALELVSLPFLIYASSLSAEKRSAYISQFQDDDETKVLLMDLKQAGQGLHVARASRVYIINPIWDAGMESQAIKRAHRIGQTREVWVETLVLKDTFEEVLMKRRLAKDDNPHLVKAESELSTCEIQTALTDDTSGQQSQDLLDDDVMVSYLKNISFLKLADDEERFARLAVPQPMVTLSDNAITADGGNTSEAPPAKRQRDSGSSSSGQDQAKPLSGGTKRARFAD